MTSLKGDFTTVFLVILTRAILSFGLNFLIPISKVDENMKTAQKRDAVRTDKFYFRKDINTNSSPGQTTDDSEEEYISMSIDEIINGKENVFPGLVPVIKDYLANMEVDIDTHCTIQQYLTLIQKRASGEIMTTARWMREFVTNHPDYKQDSVISSRIEYDLLKKCDRVSRGSETCRELLGDFSTRTKQDIPLACARKHRLLDDKIKSAARHVRDKAMF